MAEYHRKQVNSSSRWISFTIFISSVPYGVLQTALQPYRHVSFRGRVRLAFVLPLTGGRCYWFSSTQLNTTFKLKGIKKCRGDVTGCWLAAGVARCVRLVGRTSALSLHHAHRLGEHHHRTERDVTATFDTTVRAPETSR